MDWFEESDYDLDIDDLADSEDSEDVYDRFAQYKEGDSLVICDRKDSRGWVKSDYTMDMER